MTSKSPPLLPLRIFLSFLLLLPSRFLALTLSSSSNFTLDLPPTDPPTVGRAIECFNLTTAKAHPVVLEDCPFAIDLLYHDPTGVMTLQRFSRRPLPILQHVYYVPAAWQIGSCQILLTSAGDKAVDTFRLVDVIAKAMRIIEVCPPNSKRALGGISTVGNGQTFFVGVNGPDNSPDEDEGSTDGLVLVDEGSGREGAVME